MPAFVIVIIVLGVLIIAYSIYAAAKRRKMLAAWAQRRGLSFSPSNDSDMDDRFGGFKCLHRGHGRHACNIASGEWDGLGITAFDYHYTTGSGKNRQHHSFSAVIVRSPIPLKPLFIRREGFFDKVSAFFGFDDIDFESAEFSRRFFVSADDKKWAYDVIHQRMMEYLMSAPEFAIQFDSANIIAWRSRRFDPPELEAAIRMIRGMLDLLPEYLVREMTGRP